MSYAKKNSRNVLTSIVGLIAFAGIAIWQFYEYATFRVNGVIDPEGGAVHLVVAIVMALIACLIGFLIFSVFLRHDVEDELHITFAPVPQGKVPRADLR